jgi:hypothetical protein
MQPCADEVHAGVSGAVGSAVVCHDHAPAAASRRSAELLLVLTVLALGTAVLAQPEGAWAQAAQHTAAAAQQSAEIVHSSAQTARQEGSASAGLLRFFMVRRRQLCANTHANALVACCMEAVVHSVDHLDTVQDLSAESTAFAAAPVSTLCTHVHCCVTASPVRRRHTGGCRGAGWFGAGRVPRGRGRVRAAAHSGAEALFVRQRPAVRRAAAAPVAVAAGRAGLRPLTGDWPMCVLMVSIRSPFGRGKCRLHGRIVPDCMR